ncbi:hypothetical protein KIW84_050186 [Lathyrus oleraceus]|uniref:Uncharacterized protein n=1 Tax=Pisum sativum TaxID=3888 RepID=A0A9D4WJ83_PEA|nr:hypothetical protein KIW84_050186 [Pisum sativum]
MMPRGLIPSPWMGNLSLLTKGPTWTPSPALPYAITSPSLDHMFSKCKFGVGNIDYLGHLISSQGVKADPEKIKAIADWPTPTSLTTLRAFLGLTGICRHFIWNYASLASPLTDLIKSSTFSWPKAAV